VRFFVEPEYPTLQDASSTQVGNRRLCYDCAVFLEGMLRSFRLALLVALASSTALAQEIPAAEAGKHVGESATVCGVIASEHTATSSKRTPTFINLDRPYPNQVFTLLIWRDDREHVGKVPESGRICGVGTITEYRGSPEIVLRDAKSWYVPK
jgi:hypothetical protein